MKRRGIDETKASREEMCSYVCGQCHSEYYFAPSDKKLIFPWDKGLKPEEIYDYYSDKPNAFAKDWQHPDSHTLMLKAQHPDFETWSGGVHARSGVPCRSWLLDRVKTTQNNVAQLQRIAGQTIVKAHQILDSPRRQKNST
jgi:nitrite reductase (cytochrome c-552)